MEATEHGSPAIGGLRCASCGEVIGVYEPLVHVVAGIAQRTSRAADPQLAGSEAGACYHVSCSDLDTTDVISVS
jgi:hypothetical protein